MAPDAVPPDAVPPDAVAPDAAPIDEHSNGNGAANTGPDAPGTGIRPRPTLNSAVRRRRTDRAFYLRLAGAMRQNEAALKRLAQ